MDLARLKELTAYNLCEGISVADFLQKTEAERENLLWAWATQKSMPFRDWKTFLNSHIKAAAVQDR
jgi:hypothetical protein